MNMTIGEELQVKEQFIISWTENIIYMTYIQNCYFDHFVCVFCFVACHPKNHTI